MPLEFHGAVQFEVGSELPPIKFRAAGRFRPQDRQWGEPKQPILCGMTWSKMNKPYTFRDIRFFDRIIPAFSDSYSISFAAMALDMLAAGDPCMVSQIATMCQVAFTTIFLQEPLGRLQNCFRSAQLCRAGVLHPACQGKRCGNLGVALAGNVSDDRSLWRRAALPCCSEMSPS